MAFSRNSRMVWKRDFFIFFVQFQLISVKDIAYWIDIMTIKYLLSMILIMINLMPIRWIVEIRLNVLSNWFNMNLTIPKLSFFIVRFVFPDTSNHHLGVRMLYQGQGDPWLCPSWGDDIKGLLLWFLRTFRNSWG